MPRRKNQNKKVVKDARKLVQQVKRAEVRPRRRNKNNRRKQEGPLIPMVSRLARQLRSDGSLDMILRGVTKFITGFGDYKVHNNTLMTGGMQVPDIVNSVSGGGVIMRKKEFLGNVLSSTAYTFQKFTINPGLQLSFPWLSQVAQSFEQYRLRGVLYTFISTSSDAVLSNANNSALGIVGMATNYDVMDPDFTNSFELLNYQYANSRKPSESFIHPIECARNQSTLSELYIRGSAVPVGADPRLYDFGNLYVMTEGQQATGGVIGQIWVSYEVELYKPKLVDDLQIFLPGDHFLLNGVTNSVPLGSSQTPAAFNTLGGTFNSNIYRWPTGIIDGHFLLIYTCVGTSTALTAPSFVFSSAVLAVNLFSGQTLSAIDNTGTTSTRFIHVHAIQVIGPGATLTVGTLGTLPASVTTADLVVVQIPGQLTSSAVPEAASLTLPNGEEDDIRMEDDLVRMLKAFYLKRGPE
jgi:hypothetical protein